jgi:hypothetical protein
MARSVRKLLNELWQRIVPDRSERLDEPARAVKGALKRIRRLSAGGIAVPVALIQAVLVAKQEIDSSRGQLSPETGTAFFDACQKLALLAARLGDDDDDAPLVDSFSRAAVNAELMMKFAAENGTAISAEVQNDLIAAQLGPDGPVTDAPTRVKFYTAYSTMARSLGSVTADTIKACRSARTRRSLERNETKAIALALFTAVISVLLFTSGAVDKQLTDDITTANELAIKLRGNVFPPKTGTAEPAPVPPEYLHEPCNALTTAPKAGDFVVKTQADLDQLQSFTIAVRGARTRANKLNGFILGSECDPFGYCWRADEHNAAVLAMQSPTAKPQMRDRFELNPSISNYTAEFLCKVGTWQEIRDFAANVQKTYGATSGGLVAHALPILYALLGAFAYRLRQFSETVRNRTFHPSFADSARLITALIAGTVAGLFNPAKDLAVSPLATAFLVGYGVEIFFRFLDTSLSAYSAGGPAAASGPGSGAQVQAAAATPANGGAPAKVG